jgi:hypothetical protein
MNNLKCVFAPGRHVINVVGTWIEIDGVEAFERLLREENDGLVGCFAWILGSGEKIV